MHPGNYSAHAKLRHRCRLVSQLSFIVAFFRVEVSNPKLSAFDDANEESASSHQFENEDHS